ncbi:MAG: ABC transporter permease/substrate-binding protein, partial [Eubacteriaceae bacterium]|nr:ABC transporter permease/substrate-binding protein [Eubacteriaceae bacterium]
MLKDMITILWERSNFFGGLLLEHLEISLIVIAIAVIIGGITGILISEYDRAARPTLGVINFLYTIPSISMLGFLIPFSGVGNVTAVIALIIYALLPMVRATHTGIKNVDAAILEAAEGMGSTKFQILYKIKLPLAMPVIMSGIRNMVTMTIALAGIASFIGAGGLGVAIYRGITSNNAAMTMAGSLLIALLALALDFILGWVEKRMARRTSHKKHFKKSLWITLAVVVCAGIGVLGFVQSQTKDTIRIATKPMTEQYILGEMLKMLIEQDTNLNVELT